MVNKKGEDLVQNNVSSTVIAIIAIALLLVGGGRIYANYKSEQDTENGQTTVDRLQERISGVIAAENKSLNITFQGFNEDWFLTGWGIGDPRRPDKCFLHSCICVCPSPTRDSCQSAGLCREIETEEVTVRAYSIFESQPVGFPECYYRSGISLPNKIVQIELKTSENSITIEQTLRKDSDNYEVEDCREFPIIG